MVPLKHFKPILPLAAAAITAFSLIAGCRAEKEKNLIDNDAQLKNVLVLVSDDHTIGASGAYGNDIVMTPNIDRIADQGVRFENCYANAPLCSASRQSMLTGKYPHASGVTLLHTPFKDSGNVTIAEALRDKGYATAIIGKTHFNNYRDPDPPDHGFDLMVGGHDHKKWLETNKTLVADSIETRGSWKPFQDPAHEWLNSKALPGNYHDGEGSADFYVDHAIEFMKQNKDKPFFAWVAFHQPHSPYDFPVEYAGIYDPSQIPVPVGSPEDDRWIPEIFRDLTKEHKQGIISAYYTSTTYMDNNIGEILDAVAELGLEEETLVIYTSDQGYLLGEHKRFEKHMMWEESIKAPLIIKAGGRYGSGEVVNELVELIDLAPTILDILGIEPHPEMQGKSVDPYVLGETAQHKEYAFAEYLIDNKAMLTSTEWKYIYTTGQRDLGMGYQTGLGPSGIDHRLYNLKEDPNETTDLADKPEYQEKLEEMKTELLQRFKQTHPKADELPEGLTSEEQLAWFCVAQDILPEEMHYAE